MSLKVEKLENNMAKLTIEVSAEDFEKAVEATYQKQKGSIQIQGFRKGKAPRKMIENMYGKEIFFEDAANKVISESYEKAYDECEETITSSPEIEVTQIEAGKAFIYTATVALKPEVELGKYKGVTIDEVSAEVTEEEVTAEIAKEQDNAARTVSVEDRAVKAGDMTTIDFEGFADGVPFEGGKGENYPLTIGSGTFIPGFEDQLIGAELNKEVEVNVTFPEDYQAEHLAGKPVVFKCTVKEIKEKVLPELDDEFASEVSEFDTLAEYKADVRAKLEEKKAKDVKNAKEDAAIAAVVEGAKMQIPDPMLATEQRQMFDQFAQRISMQGMQVEQYLQYTGMTKEAMIEQLKPQAEQKIKSRLCMEAVAAAENIVATEEDYEKEIATMADVYQMEVEKVREMLDETSKKQIMGDLAVQKAIEFVAENAKAKKAKKAKAEETDAEEKAAKKAPAKKTTAKKTTKKAEETEE